MVGRGERRLQWSSQRFALDENDEERVKTWRFGLGYRVRFCLKDVSE